MSSTAIVTKARTLYSMHLDMHDYRHLSEQKRVDDVASLLAKNERYEEVLKGLGNVELHRDILEQFIRTIVPLEFKSLLRYADAKSIKDIYVLDVERDLIIDVLYALGTDSRAYAGRDVVELNDLMSFDMQALLSAKHYDEIAEVLHSSFYGGILKRKDSKAQDLWITEFLLHNFYVTRMSAKLKKRHKTIQDLFMMHIELLRIANIYRLLQSRQLNTRNLSDVMEWIPYRIGKREIMNWVASNSAEVFLEQFKESYYGKFAEVSQEDPLELMMDKIRLKTLRHALRFATDADVALYAYKELSDLEIRNIIKIIEGVRYQIPSQEIGSYLVV